MAIVIKKQKLSLCQRFYLFQVLAGMWITIGHFFRNIINPSGLSTLNYPEEKRRLADNYRGLPRLLKDEKGELKCVACKLCAVACPSHCITIEMAVNEQGKPLKSPSRFDLDAGRCIFCGYCEEACPFDAIDLNSGIYELADEDLGNFLYTKEDLAAGKKKGAP